MRNSLRRSVFDTQCRPGICGWIVTRTGFQVSNIFAIPSPNEHFRTRPDRAVIPPGRAFGRKGVSTTGDPCFRRHSIHLRLDLVTANLGFPEIPQPSWNIFIAQKLPEKPVWVADSPQARSCGASKLLRWLSGKLRVVQKTARHDCLQN
jgi:hypothetical protein